MTEYRVEIKDASNHTLNVLIQVRGLRKGTRIHEGTWMTLEKGVLRREKGFVDTGTFPAPELAEYGWLSVYGADNFHDKNLVFHIDDFRPFTVMKPGHEGVGWIYPGDNLRMEAGWMTWRLTA